MLTINETVIPEGDAELGDNLLYYDYNIDHLLSLEAKGLTMEDEGYISAFRSFEGEVYENYIYEKLLTYYIFLKVSFPTSYLTFRKILYLWKKIKAEIFDFWTVAFC